MAATRQETDDDPALLHHPAFPPMIWPAILTGFVVAMVLGLGLALGLFRLLLCLVRREDHR